jgi:hypothetical protein
MRLAFTKEMASQRQMVRSHIPEGNDGVKHH